MTGLAPPMTHSEIKLARILLILGVIGGLPSVWETLSFSWDPTFQAPALREGPRHTNYHAFREFTLTIGALGTMLWVMFQPAARQSRALWVAMGIAGVSTTLAGGCRGRCSGCIPPI